MSRLTGQFLLVNHNCPINRNTAQRGIQTVELYIISNFYEGIPEGIRSISNPKEVKAAKQPVEDRAKFSESYEMLKNLSREEGDELVLTIPRSLECHSEGSWTWWSWWSKRHIVRTTACEGSVIVSILSCFPDSRTEFCHAKLPVEYWCRHRSYVTTMEQCET
jgi:hypothetical protein